MDDALITALEWRRRGRGVALATVLETWGSAPRPAGACMAVDGSGAFVGSVSGGCVETAVVSEAREVLDDGAPRLLEFGVSDAEAWSVGLPCGGRIRIRLELLDDELARVLGRAAEECRGGRAVVLATGLDDDAIWLLRPGSAEATSRRAAAATDGGGDVLVTATAGEAPRALRDAAVDAARLDHSFVHDVAGREYFLRALSPPLRMVLVGAVHIAQELAPMARRAGFAVTVVDPRRAFATPERFPGTELRTSWPDEALPDLRPDGRTAVVVLAHDPKLDDPALVAALQSDAYYIGALGSRRTQAARRRRLARSGFEQEALQRIHGPVGLDLGGRFPAEIAVAVLAEAILVLRQGATARGNGRGAADSPA